MSVTKKYKRLAFIFSIISFLLNITPISVYVIMALSSGALLTDKIALSMTVFVVAILSIVAWMNKTTMRSRIWIIMIGLYFVLDYFAAAIITIGVCQVIDEWILCPIKNHYKNKFVINKEIDKRL